MQECFEFNVGLCQCHIEPLEQHNSIPPTEGKICINVDFCAQPHSAHSELAFARLVVLRCYQSFQPLCHYVFIIVIKKTSTKRPPMAPLKPAGQRRVRRKPTSDVADFLIQSVGHRTAVRRHRGPSLQAVHFVARGSDHLTHHHQLTGRNRTHTTSHSVMST